MKKRTANQRASGKRATGMRGNAVPSSIDEYLAGVPEPARSTLQKVRATIRAAAPPSATEAISYGIPTFRYEGALVAFGAFARHCSLFPMSMAVIGLFQDELQDSLASKGTIHFPLDKPLPAGLLRKIVKARVAEKLKKKSGKS